MTVRIAIVDDHTLFRCALAQLLELQPDFELVGQAGDATGAVAMTATSRPDVLLLDVDIPGPGAVQTVATLRAVEPQVSIIMLSMVDDPTTIRSLLATGVRGYLLKSCSDAELHAAIRSVVAEPGKLVLSVTSQLFSAEPEPEQAVPLTHREHQALLLASQALSNRQIGSRLGVTEATVKRHLHNAFAKLGATSRIDAVNRAIAMRLITPTGAGAGTDTPV